VYSTQVVHYSIVPFAIKSRVYPSGAPFNCSPSEYCCKKVLTLSLTCQKSKLDCFAIATSIFLVYYLEHLLVEQLNAQLTILWNIRLGWKLSPGVNTPAYFDKVSIMKIENIASLYRGAPEWCSARVDSIFTLKYHTSLKTLACVKHSSLIRHSINFENKHFIAYPTGEHLSDAPLG
jgi:hypothetical protein